MENPEEILQSILDWCPRLSSKNFKSDFIRIMNQKGYQFSELTPVKERDTSLFCLIQNTDEFIRKGQGRIFVRKAEDIPLVNKIIEELDSFEHDYMSNDFITVFNEARKPEDQMIYSDKFEPSVPDILAACEKAGIDVRIVAGRDPYEYSGLDYDARD